MRRTIMPGLLLLLVTFLFARQLFAAGFSIEAQVDRNEVGFGESLNLVVTITQELNSGRATRLSVPSIDNIPGFDIASTRSGQSTSFINGVGQAKSQIVYELVPQQPGKATIPAFSFKDADGDTHSTNPVEINVLPPQESPAEAPPEPTPAAAASSGTPLFNGLLFVGLILGCIVAIPFVLSAFFNRNVKPSTRWQESGGGADAEPGAGLSGKDKKTTAVEDAQIVQTAENARSRPEKIDFSTAVGRLKREYPEVDINFYNRYFALFKNAMLGNSVSVTADMTMDELLKKVCEINSREDIAAACKRLARDLEMVLYANISPSRNFATIDADAREIINAISE